LQLVASAQPFGQAVIVDPQAPAPSHVSADVRMSLAHIGPAPHDVPGGSLPVSMHTELPVVHTVIPVLQRLPPGRQLTPAVQDTQLPPLQTWLFPHDVPSSLSVVSLQTA
jgi:hypothetical protein